MEVLISIGILSIGLASVIALVPAGGNEARRALIEDRRAALGAAALADCINRGFLQPAMWDPAPSPPPDPPYHIVMDPDPLGTGSVFPPHPAMTRVTLVGMTTQQADDVFRGGDDLAYEKPEDEDAPAVPVYELADGAVTRRSIVGAFSWLATLLPTGTANPDHYRLTIVTFHQRQLPAPIFIPPAGVPCTGTTGTSDVRLDADLPALPNISPEDFRDTFTRGGAVLLMPPALALDEPVWRTIVLPMPIPASTGGGITGADLHLNAPVPFAAASIYVFPGSVGVSEKLVTLEGPSPWSF
jgi:hypothetical protein